MPGPMLVATRLAMHTWQSLVVERTPWASMPADDRDGYNRILFDALFSVHACANVPDRNAMGLVYDAARQHVAFRTGQGLSRRDLRQDLTLVRVAVLEVLHMFPATVPRPNALMYALHFATAAALRDGAEACSGDPDAD